MSKIKHTPVIENLERTAAFLEYRYYLKNPKTYKDYSNTDRFGTYISAAPNAHLNAQKSGLLSVDFGKKVDIKRFSNVRKIRVFQYIEDVELDNSQ